MEAVSQWVQLQLGVVCCSLDDALLLCASGKDINLGALAQWPLYINEHVMLPM